MKIEYRKADIADAEFENKYDATVPENDAVKDIITKQHPDIDFEEIKNRLF